MITIFKHLALLSVLVALTACSTNPSQVATGDLTRGSVVRTSDNTIIVCLGNEKHTEPGSIFSVYRATYTGSIEENTDTYSRESVGKIRILRPLNDHFARARVQL